MSEREHDRYIVALEIGSSKVRAAVGKVDNLGILEVVAVEEDKIIDKVRYGGIQNVEVAGTVSTVLERLEANPAVHPRHIEGVYVSLSGRSLSSTITEVSITLPEETEITEPILQQLTTKAAATVASDRDVVNVLPVSFTVDNKAQINPVGTFGNVVGARMTVVSCNSQLKRMLRRVVAERLNLNICDFITLPLAEANMVLSDDERRLGCMFVDFGAETTSVVIYRAGAPIYLATLPMGSRNITLDITTLKKLEETAEEIKKTSGHALSPDPGRRVKGAAEAIDYTEINNYIHARAAEIAANIVAQLDYAGITMSNLDSGIVIVGGGARLRGFNDLLSQQSKMQVRQGLPSAKVRLTDGSIQGADVIDVISVLAEAAEQPERVCLSELPQVDPATIDVADGTYESLNATEEDDDETTSRIGRLDYDDDFGANPNPKKEKETKKKSPRPETIHRLGIFERVKEGIRRMTEDNSGDFTDN